MSTYSTPPGPDWNKILIVGAIAALLEVVQQVGGNYLKPPKKW